MKLTDEQIEADVKAYGLTDLGNYCVAEQEHYRRGKLSMLPMLEEKQNTIDSLKSKNELLHKALKDIDSGKLPIGNIVENALSRLRECPISTKRIKR